MGWLLLALGVGWYWWQSRATASATLTDATHVRAAESMLRTWLTTSANMPAVPAFTGDTFAPGAAGYSPGNATDPAFMSALKTFQGWTNAASVEFQESPHSFPHKLRADGVLDKATYGVLAAFTQPPTQVLTGADFRELS